MLRLRYLTAATLIALATTGCMSMNVASHYDRGVNFSQFRTWDWGAPDALPVGDPRLDNNPFFVDHLQGAIERAMARRGFTRVAPGETPDLLVHYHASVNQRFEVNEPDANCYGNCQANVIEYEQGTLVLDVLDGRTERMLWRGWAQDSVQGILDRQDLMERKVNEAVTKMFARFPGRG